MKNNQKGVKKKQNWSQNRAELANVLQNVIENSIFEKVGSQRVSVIRGCLLLEPFWRKMEIPASILAPLDIRRGTRNRAFQCRSAPLAPKMLSKRCSGAKVEKWMKNGSKQICFSMEKPSQTMPCAMNSRFSQLKKSRKIHATMTSKSHEQSFKMAPQGA